MQVFMWKWVLPLTVGYYLKILSSIARSFSDATTRKDTHVYRCLSLYTRYFLCSIFKASKSIPGSYCPL